MQINIVNSVIGWFGDRLQTETRSVYHYDRGNDVTVVERRYVDLHLYDHRAVVPATHPKGSRLDIRA